MKDSRMIGVFKRYGHRWVQIRYNGREVHLPYSSVVFRPDIPFEANVHFDIKSVMVKITKRSYDLFGHCYPRLFPYTTLLSPSAHLGSDNTTFNLKGYLEKAIIEVV